ncbi:MAG: DUF971 domain-containing protein [Alphaproteobacteria bacterium]|jgi:DUF971 family protein|nr:DUF971 domain-containing protein [Alphaproteobacteria bacterium]
MDAPTEIRVSADRRRLTLVWPAGPHTLSAHTLRVESPSAEVKGHFGRGGVAPVGKEHVTITGLEPVGSYALKIIFSDGHQTGLYTWDYLSGLGGADA